MNFPDFFVDKTSNSIYYSREILFEWRKQMRRKGIFIIVAVMIMVSAFVGCSKTSQPQNEKKIAGTAKQETETQRNKKSEIITLDGVKTKASQIYEASYQENMKRQIETLKDSKKYTMRKPLLVDNPYGTVSNGLYVYFNTKNPKSFEYSVNTPGYPEYTARLNNEGENNLSTEHEYILLGAIPGEENTITLYKLNKKGKRVKSVSFVYIPKEIENDYGYKKEVEDGNSTEDLTDGLYVIFRNDITKGDGGICTIMFDNEGIVRCVIPLINYRSNRLLFDENGMYFEVSTDRIVRMDRTGYVNKIYDTGAYALHHDMIFGKKNDLLVCATTKDSDVEEDMIISVDLESGKVSEFMDMKVIFSDYYDNAVWGDYKGTLDWVHINSLDFTEDGGLLISARETSTIVKVKNPYGKQRIDYLIASEKFYENTKYKSKILKRVGDFSLQGGQHSLQVINDGTLKEGQYYLVLYNNNYTNSTYGATTYDWSADENYYDQGFTKSGEGEDVVSYYYKYLIDENKKTVKLADKIDVKYSSILSSVQVYKDHIITLSGNPHVANEFDSEGNLIRRFTSPSSGYTYRCYKYDFDGFWYTSLSI